MYRSINNRIQVIQQMWPKGKWVQRFFFLIELIFTLNSTFTQEYPIYQIPLGIEVDPVQEDLATKSVTNRKIYPWNSFAAPEYMRACQQIDSLAVGYTIIQVKLR